MDEADRQEVDSNDQQEMRLGTTEPFVGTDGLTEDIRQRLDAHLDEFEEGVKTPSFDAVAYVRKLVGSEFLMAATSHLVVRRLERMRTAARNKGFQLGI